MDLPYLARNPCYSCLCLPCFCHFFHSCFALTFVGGVFAVSPHCHGMIHQCFAQPTLLSDHQVQGLQTKARNHVLASLDSKCHEPPCTPDRLRTSSYQKCTLLPRMNQQHQGPTHPDGSSQTLQPGGFPDQHPLPSRHTLRLGLVATWIRPVIVLVAIFSREGFFFPGFLREAAICRGPGMIRSLMTQRS